MYIQLGQKFRLPYRSDFEPHEISVSFTDSDLSLLPESMQDISLEAKVVYLRDLAMKMIEAEAFAQGALPQQEVLNKIREREARIYKHLFDINTRNEIKREREQVEESQPKDDND